MPRIAYKNGVAGRQVVVADELPPQQHDAVAPRPPRARRTSRSRASRNFVVGDKITVDQAANGFGAGDPEVRTITAVGTAGATGTGITLDAPLEPRARERALRRGLARGHVDARHAGLRPRWWYTQKDGAQTAQPHQYWGWRYLQVLPPGARRDADRRRHHRRPAVPATRPPSRRATFDSDNATLDAVFDLMQHSAIHSLRGDVPGHADAREGPVHRRHRGHLARDDDRRRRPRRDRARDPRDHLLARRTRGRPPSSGYCTAAQLPCSYPSIGTPGPRERRLSRTATTCATSRTTR